MNKAVNIGNKFWNTNKGAATFRSCCSKFGIINENGEALFNSHTDQPSIWGTLKVAKMCAPHCDGFKNTHWAKVYDTAEEAA